MSQKSDSVKQAAQIASNPRTISLWTRNYINLPSKVAKQLNIGNQLTHSREAFMNTCTKALKLVGFNKKMNVDEASNWTWDNRQKIWAVVSFLPNFVLFMLGLLREPTVGLGAKTGMMLAMLYVTTPLDAIPDAIPLVGLLDDSMVAIFAVRSVLASLGSVENQHQIIRKHWHGRDEDLGKIEWAAAAANDLIITSPFKIIMEPIKAAINRNATLSQQKDEPI